MIKLNTPETGKTYINHRNIISISYQDNRLFIKMINGQRIIALDSIDYLKNEILNFERECFNINEFIIKEEVK